MIYNNINIALSQRFVKNNIRSKSSCIMTGYMPAFLI